MSPRHDPNEVARPPNGDPLVGSDDLPYAVVLWNLPRTAPERVLARAASANLARAIFKAAQSEHLGRKIVLVQGARTIAETE